MPGITPRGYPYLTGGDVPDIGYGLQTLAEAIDADLAVRPAIAPTSYGPGWASITEPRIASDGRWAWFSAGILNRVSGTGTLMLVIPAAVRPLTECPLHLTATNPANAAGPQIVGKIATNGEVTGVTLSGGPAHGVNTWVALGGAPWRIA